MKWFRDDDRSENRPIESLEYPPIEPLNVFPRDFPDGKPADAKLNGNFANASLNFRDRRRPLFQLCNAFLELASSFIFDGFLAPIDLNKEAEGEKSENEDEDWCADQANELEKFAASKPGKCEGHPHP